MDLVENLFGNLIAASRRHLVRERLMKLADRLLRDIGLERDDIPNHVDATIPWLSRDSRLSHATKRSMQAFG